eukprot:12165659-Ditylum_brightwellii.AAC.1
MESAYLCLWDPLLHTRHPLGWESGVPSSKQILEDMQHIPNYSILKGIEARGAVKTGEVQEKKSFSERFMHPDAVSVVIPSGQNNDQLENDDNIDMIEI